VYSGHIKAEVLWDRALSVIFIIPLSDYVFDFSKGLIFSYTVLLLKYVEF